MNKVLKTEKQKYAYDLILPLMSSKLTLNWLNLHGIVVLIFKLMLVLHVWEKFDIYDYEQYQITYLLFLPCAQVKENA